MRGQVLGVDARTGDGLVAGEDGRRYTFTPDDWAGRGGPAIGLQVDFETRDARALSLFPLAAPASVPAGIVPPSTLALPPRSKWIAAILAFLFGPLGVHRFYLGRTGSGIAMLVMSCTVAGLLLTVPWGFVDMVRYLLMSDAEIAHRYPRG